MGLRAKDLRIGNYVSFRDDSNSHREQIIKTVDLLAISYDTAWADGVVLTEELLLGCGFKKTPSVIAEYKIDSFPDIHVSKGFASVVAGCCDGEMPYDLEHIKYVHQLQNLYFALTNEELKIK